MIVWCDVETTGLDAELDYLLSVALLATDDDLNEIGDPIDIVIQHTLDSPQFAARLDAHDGITRQMHTQSGLLLDVGLSEVTATAAGIRLVGWMENLRQTVPPIMGGASITLDRSFLAEHQPGLLAAFHYRSIDVTTVRELAARWAPDLRENEPRNPDGTRHRGISDIRDSITLLRYYREQGFIGGES